MKQACCRPPHASRGIGPLGLILIAVIIVGGLVGCGKTRSTASQEPIQAVDRTETGTAPGQLTAGPAQSIPGRALQKAMGTKCTENLRQVRMMVDSAKSETEDNAYPADLAGVQGINQIKSCPLGHEPYTYDPTTGKVSCPHPGHEKF